MSQQQSFSRLSRDRLLTTRSRRSIDSLITFIDYKLVKSTEDEERCSQRRDNRNPHESIRISKPGVFNYRMKNQGQRELEEYRQDWHKKHNDQEKFAEAVSVSKHRGTGRALVEVLAVRSPPIVRGVNNRLAFWTFHVDSPFVSSVCFGSVAVVQ